MGRGEVTDGGRWFTELADHMQGTYLRYSFTKGTRHEVDFLWSALGLEVGSRVLDAGCGPGRHVRELRSRGVDAVGLDIAESFCRLVAAGDPRAPVVVADVRAIPFRGRDVDFGSFDAVISLCQGGFGLLGGPGAPVDAEVRALAQLASCLRPGGRLAVSAFSSYFQVRWLEESDTFDAAAGVNHERTVIRSDAGEEREVDLWTTGFTPRELRLLAASAGLVVDAVWSVEPGAYAPNPPDLAHPEFLLLAHRPRPT